MSLQKELDRIRNSVNEILLAVDKITNADKLGKPITELGLSNRTINCLARRNIKYLDELLELSRLDIMRIQNIGKHTFNEITQKLTELGIAPHLSPDPRI